MKHLHLRELSLRIKLTLIFFGVMAVVLTAIGLFLFFRTKTNLDAGIRQTLRVRSGELIQSIRQNAGSDSAATLIQASEGSAQIVDGSGRVLESRPAGLSALLSPAEVRTALGRRAMFIERGEEHRLLVVPVHQSGRVYVTVTRASLSQREHALEGLSRALAIGGPLGLLLASALAYMIASAALRPVEAMRRRASQLTTADPEARLPVSGTRDEIHRLALTLNDMLARMAQAAEHERAFVANASHELRTPVATIRTELELALRHAGTVDEFRRAARAAIADADDLARLADDLLVLARADRTGLPLRCTDVDVDALLRDVASEAARDPRAVGRRFEVQADAVHAEADPDRLRQAAMNMTRNAVLHGSGTVTVGATVEPAAVCIWVSDQGGPLPADVLATAFDRFARAADAVNRPGTGLGLSIVREIATAHGGEVRLENTDAGVRCVLRLPTAVRASVPGVSLLRPQPAVARDVRTRTSTPPAMEG
ncbi:HAMP domain-containing protein [Baekduia soli]|uniref:histidine kinase n=1 Tax=Baekduia soli TaxID=496014 RepID=A0A5B8U708_9ACTN|nr:ATP-binding protein [Baekduia soli]QEC48780.1 HAMP domain-containing protein [Baekduia soli]